MNNSQPAPVARLYAILMALRPAFLLVLFAALCIASVLARADARDRANASGLSAFAGIASADTATLEGRAATLSNLDDLIPAARRAAIDAARDSRARALESVVTAPGTPQTVNLRSRDTKVKTQFSAWSGLSKVGTCSDFGLVATMENKLGGQVDLSERHFWSEYHIASSDSAITAASTGDGIVESIWWPSSNTKPFVGYLNQPWYKLAQYQDLDSDLSQVIASLAAGDPVYVALSTPEDMYENCSTHIDPNSGPLPDSGHALAVVGYALEPSVPGGGELLLKNSWGTSCGDGGYQWLPFNLCSKAGMYCQFWAVQSVTHD